MSTLRLANALAARGWDIDFVVTTGGGELEAKLDPRIRLTQLRSRPVGEQMAGARGLGATVGALPDAVSYVGERLREAAVTRRFRGQHFDAAIIGLQGLSGAFVCERIEADRRLLFIRSDVGSVARDDKVARNVEGYGDRIDAYVCVSKYAREALEKRYPGAIGKAVTIYNVLGVDDMRRQAEGAADPFAKYGSAPKILTVCRLQEAPKGLKRMADVCRRLLDERLDFHWFVVGDGPDRAMLEAKIEDLGLQGRMILLGQQANPFPFYAHADLVAALSYYEGLCGAVNEAKVMGKPVIATTFSGIAEQIEDSVGGLIVQNDEDAIVEGMRRLLTDSALRATLAAGPLNPAILDDDAKLDALEALLLGAAA